MQTGLFIVFAFAIGAISSIYLPMNSSVARYLGSPLTASITFCFVALVTSILLFVTFGKPATIFNIGAVPPYLYLTGFISAFIVLSITFLIPILGARKLVILSLAGQILMAMVVSHLGILESPPDPITVKKVLGASLFITGAIVSVT
ncbi:MAG: DMT family transporter [Gammaproteobacteria bacterium]|nr:DMT family transporter [Gammaproteobacteria bacterium]